MGDSDNARLYLDNLRRGDLSALLAHVRIKFGVLGASLGDEGVVVLTAPQPFHEAVQALPQRDRKRIAEAVLSRRPNIRVPEDIVIKLSGDPVEEFATLLPDLIIHREMMISVATGGGNIDDLDDYYAARQIRLVQKCSAAGIRYENPHEGLWDWFHYWKAQGFDSWAQRRQYVRKLFTGPIASAAGFINRPGPATEREPTGWERVDRVLAKARTLMNSAAVEEDWQSVGLLCREVLISLAQAVHRPEVHPTKDERGTFISRTDAKRLLEVWLQQECEGGSNKEIRAHIRASLDLANNLQHRRTATRQLAALCLEATSSVVAVVAILAGRWER